MILRLIELKDIDAFYELKADPSNVFWTGWKNLPEYSNIKKFVENVINNLKTIQDRRIYVAEDNGEIIGYVYIDYVNEDTFHLSPAVHSKYQGKGYGKELIGLGLKEGLRLGYKNMEAYIREDNVVSQKCFEYNGAHKTDTYQNKYIENQEKEIKMIRYLYESK